MRWLCLLFVCLFCPGCSVETGSPVVGVGPEGVVVYKKGEVTKTYAWDAVTGLVADRQLNAASKERKSYPVLRLRTEKGQEAIASSYSERVDPKAYAGQYLHLSISAGDLEQLKSAIIEGAGLVPHPESETVWVKPKKADQKPPSESTVYSKKIGG